MIIMLPDYRGQATDFVSSLRTAHSTAIIVAVVNGEPSDWSAPREYQDCKVEVVRSAPGLATALQDGYRHIIDKNLAGPVVRIDTAEHPIQHIARLVSVLEETHHQMVIGDLVCAIGETLVADTPDAVAHLKTMPEMYGAATKGVLPLSCAHGFSAFASAQVLEQTLQAAEQILSKTGQSDQPQWGFDGAMALGAYAAGLRPARVPVEAAILRNRSAAKVAAQVTASEKIIAAAAAAFPEVFQ